MRIANNIIFIAVVSLAACVEGWQRGTRSMTNSKESLSDSFEEMSSAETWIRPKERDFMLEQAMIETGRGLECCPSVEEMVEPLGGMNQEGRYVELYKDNGTAGQRFYELSCRKEVVDRPCRFMDRKLHNQSKCVQQYSHSYAIIKTEHEHLRHAHNNSPTANWTLGYIKVRSGCACVISPRPKRKRASHHKVRRGKRREGEEDSLLNLP